jgi:hypothetical protein
MIPGCEPAKAERAAFLAKADLSTGMVGEFPELQGIMGRYYAKADGEDAAVAEAVREHYQPLGPADRCPSAPVSIAVALADKLDTLVGFFADEKPTGSTSPSSAHAALASSSSSRTSCGWRWRRSSMRRWRLYRPVLGDLARVSRPCPADFSATACGAPRGGRATTR